MLGADRSEQITSSLRRYSETLTPWAQAAGERMVNEVAARNEAEWKGMSQEIAASLARDIARAPIGVVIREQVQNQVTLIKSLPLEAALRVQDLAMKAALEGRRTKDIEEEILRTGDVTKSRATLIARTEVGRAQTEITKARAKIAGSEGYIWRTVKDRAVRPSHRAMEGKFVRWDEAPTLDGLTGHAGAIPNCRCYCEVVLPG